MKILKTENQTLKIKHSLPQASKQISYISIEQQIYTNKLTTKPQIKPNNLKNNQTNKLYQEDTHPETSKLILKISNNPANNKLDLETNWPNSLQGNS